MGKVMAKVKLQNVFDVQALLGQIPLEGLDLVVRPKTQDVMPNPEHPDGPVMEVFAAAG
jgi:hypothetical protein